MTAHSLTAPGRWRPQTQERHTKRIADHLGELLEPRGVGIVVEAEHTCMTLRGVRAEFLSLAGRSA
jgi:GTP cyclohydrolase I